MGVRSTSVEGLHLSVAMVSVTHLHPREDQVEIGHREISAQQVAVLKARHMPVYEGCLFSETVDLTYDFSRKPG